MLSGGYRKRFVPARLVRHFLDSRESLASSSPYFRAHEEQTRLGMKSIYPPSPSLDSGCVPSPKALLTLAKNAVGACFRPHLGRPTPIPISLLRPASVAAVAVVFRWRQAHTTRCTPALSRPQTLSKSIRTTTRSTTWHIKLEMDADDKLEREGSVEKEEETVEEDDGEKDKVKGERPSSSRKKNTNVA
uniref:Uncharacterized protein n=1 Tax=Mycena chlorophos TaxID=658473 RepID=A0ABQ0L6R0_MYCCL|nr:predicted protein [Mycena chlorophos]